MNKRNNLLLRQELEALSNLRLSKMLREELQRDRPDGDKVRLLLQVLEAREENTPPIDDRALAAWERFQKDCADSSSPAPKPQKKRNRWLQLGAIAAVLCLVLLVIPTARGNDDFFFRVGTWKDTVLEFFHPSEVQQEYIFRTDHPGLQRVYDEVSALGVTQPVVPSWVPMECMLTELKITNTPSRIRVYAVLSDKENRVAITIDIFGSDTPRKYETDGPNTEHIELGGIIHSVTGNEGARIAFWTRDNIECSLTVDYEEDILDRILNSIYVTEAN